MKLEQALGAILARELKNGLGALKPDQRKKIRVVRTQKKSCSIDLDESLKKQYPEESRWDYLIAIETHGFQDDLYYVEFHPAMAHEVSVIQKKYQWLLDWIHSGQTHLKDWKGRSHWFWIATDKIKIQKNSPQDRSIRRLQLYPIRNLEIG